MGLLLRLRLPQMPHNQPQDHADRTGSEKNTDPHHPLWNAKIHLMLVSEESGVGPPYR